MSEVERPRSLSKLTTGTVSESDTEYLDATEHVTYSDSLELLDTIAETQITLNLFLNNKFDMAEERMAELADRSMYHSLGLNSIVFIKAMMTCDKKDMEKSLQLCKKSCTMIEGFRQKFSLSETFLSLGGKQRHITDGIISLFIQFTYELYILITFYLINTIRVLIEIYYLYLCSTIPKFLPIKEEIHAELCYAETLLCRAVLSFFQDDNFTSFLRGALRIRTCYQIYRSCERMMNDYSLWEGRDPQVRSQFESGVRMGLGTFNLMLSTLPSKVLRLLEVVGFSGDKVTGMVELHRCAAMTSTLHSPLCIMLLLTWHLVICFMFGAGQPDIQLCHRLMPQIMQKYPKGAIVLFLRARLLLVSSDIDSAIYFFNKSVESQDVYKQFHHGCYWELLFAHSYLRQWAKAANYAKKLVNESKWSRCVYTYMLCIFFAADETTDPTKRDETAAALAKKVDNLRQRIAGKSIPVEKYCAKKANRFVANKSLMFAHYEFIYFWNGFDILGCNSQLMQPILEDIDRIWQMKKSEADADDRCLYLFLRAVCLRQLHNPLQAEEALQEILEIESQLTDFTYLPPNATYELALIRISEGRRHEAEALLAKSRQYKGYSLENKLHFRIHSAMENLGSRTPIM